MGKKKRKTYTEEFRRQAVSLADQQGKTAREVADSLGIHVNQIYNWRTQFSKISKNNFKYLMVLIITRMNWLRSNGSNMN